MQNFLGKKISTNIFSSLCHNLKSYLPKKIYIANKSFSSNYGKINDGSSIDEVMGNNNSGNPYGQFAGSNSYSNINAQNQYQNKKRNRLSFLRDGMMLTLYLRKVIFLFLIFSQ
jgi:hypothetical protein